MLLLDRNKLLRLDQRWSRGHWLVLLCIDQWRAVHLPADCILYGLSPTKVLLKSLSLTIEVRVGLIFWDQFAWECQRHAISGVGKSLAEFFVRQFLYR